MDSNEEYLDQLLKSLTEESTSGAPGGSGDLDQDDGLGDLLNQFSDDMDSVPEDLLSGLLGGAEAASEELPDVSTESSAGEEAAELSGMLQDLAGEESSLDVPVEEVEEAPWTIEQSAPELAGEEDFETSEIPNMETLVQPASDGDEEADFVMSDFSDAGELDQSILGMDEEEPFALPETSDTDALEPSAGVLEEDDLGSLLESLGADGDEDAQEISSLLDQAERDEPIDDMVDSLMQGLSQGLEPDDGANEPQNKPDRKGKKKKERPKKEKKPRRSKKKQGLEDLAASLPEEISEDTWETGEDTSGNLEQETGNASPEESAPKEKKQGFWGKLLNALTQEDEDEEEDPAALVSDENGAILEELDKEKKQSKGKKKKKGKEKKAVEVDEDEDLEEAPDAKKKKKEKKPKKEKPPVSAEELLPGKKLPLKKALPIVAVLLVFCLAYVMVSHLYIDHVNKQRAEKAYYAEDYLECYGLLLGQDRNESQELMFHRSELVLQMERMKGNYRRLVMEGKELEALDYLVQSVCRKESAYLQGQEWNCLDVVEKAYGDMTALLTANYGLTEERAGEIAALRKDEDYTIALIQVLEGVGSESKDEESVPQDPSASYEDLLPEEEENQEDTFIDTM